MKSSTLLKRVIHSMEKIAPLSLAETSWDNVGVLIEAPYPRENASKVFLTIDLTQEVLEEAISDQFVAVIVAYHPAIFRPLKRLRMSDVKERIALKCAASGISVYSPHTALDSCVGGINDWLAKSLGAGRTVPIKPVSTVIVGQEGSGIGRLHTLDEPASLDDIIGRVKAFLNLQRVRVAKCESHKDGSARISTIAICAGSGASVLSDVPADLFLTGEMSHHEILATISGPTSAILCEHTNTGM